MSLVVTEEYCRIFDHLESNNSGVVFLTGNAGTGKSTFLRYFEENTKKSFIKLAPTGRAALNISGQTVHSFFKFPLHLLVNYEPKDSAMLAAQMTGTDIIIIDEFGMIRADMLDAMDVCLRKATGKDRPFGGKQILGIGDLFQLPPVLTTEERSFFADHYAGRYFFHANCIKEADMIVCTLTETFRQKNLGFVEFLNEIRLGKSSYPIEKINKRFYKSRIPNDFQGIVLCTANAPAENLNRMRLSKLGGSIKVYECITEGIVGSSRPVPDLLELKIGAKVVFCKNTAEFTNGETGYVTKFNEKSVEVKKDNGLLVRADYESWDNIQYKNGKPKTIGTFKQIPLKLAWAITIHKSQGMTFSDRVIVDTGNGCFETGQFYVALSRVTDSANLSMLREVKITDIAADPDVVRFCKETELQPDVEGF